MRVITLLDVGDEDALARRREIGSEMRADEAVPPMMTCFIASPPGVDGQARALPAHRHGDRPRRRRKLEQGAETQEQAYDQIHVSLSFVR